MKLTVQAYEHTHEYVPWRGSMRGIMKTQTMRLDEYSVQCMQRILPTSKIINKLLCEKKTYR